MPRAVREEGRTLASVDRALTLLDALAERPAGARVGELSELTGVNQSTTSRLLGTLMARGFVERDDATGRYRLGLRLVEQTGETATLSVPGDTQPFTIDFVPSPSNVASRGELGRPSVNHATVTGKLLLAFGPLALERLGPEPYERFTDRTLTTRAELGRELDRVRAEGVAYGREEREPGLNAVGAAVLGREQTLHAMLSIQGPANRLHVR